MKRKVVMRLLCVSIASVMLVSNTAVLVAGEETRTAIYNGQQVTVTVNGDKVILPDGQIIALTDCELIPEQVTPTPVPESTDSQTTVPPEAPSTEAPNGETPDIENPDVETPDTEVPDTENPDIEEPDIENPDTEVPDTENPDTEAPDTENPDIENPDAGTPGTENPDAGNPDTETPAPSEPLEKPAEGNTSLESNGLPGVGNPFTGSKEDVPSLSIASPSLKAGIGFYVDELKDTYRLEFSETFAKVLTDIESEYREASVNEAIEAAAKKAQAEAEVEAAELPASEEPVFKIQVAEDVVLEDIKAEDLKISVKNWQDIVAVYLLEQSRAGVTEFRLDDSCKARLAELLSEMNTPTITAEELICEPQYIDAYIEGNTETLTESEITFLREYTSSSFSLLCSAATGAEGFILESLGADVSAERAQVVAAGYSLVGKIPYFWGGKSSVVGWDDRWGNPAQVTAAGTSSSGTIQNYGLDCSGFVTWAFVNGYENSAASSLIGHGTATQWAMSEAVSEEEALPGDLVFLQQPNAAGINHVGIVVGRNDDGSLIAVHCNAGKNGVTVDSAYQAGFRYVRRPLTYTDDEAEALTGKQVRLQELKEKITQENEKVLTASAVTK